MPATSGRGQSPEPRARARHQAQMALYPEQIGIDAVLRTWRSLGVQTRLQRYATTAFVDSAPSVSATPASARRTLPAGWEWLLGHATLLGRMASPR
jgi:hypothetical protein